MKRLIELIATVDLVTQVAIDPMKRDITKVTFQDRHALAKHTAPVAKTLVPGVHPRSSQIGFEVTDATALRQPDPQIVIESVMQFAIQSAGGLESIAAHEAGRLADVTVVAQVRNAAAAGGIGLKDSAIVADPITLAVDGGRVGIGEQVFHG
jgi:hypothetical protein